MIKTVIPSILKLKDDKVANVKFSLCIVLKSLYEFLISNNKQNLESSLEETRGVLNKLLNDDDVDVKYFSKQALESLNIK
jgi:hypothetical protein